MVLSWSIHKCIVAHDNLTHKCIVNNFVDLPLKGLHSYGMFSGHLQIIWCSRYQSWTLGVFKMVYFLCFRWKYVVVKCGGARIYLTLEVYYTQQHPTSWHLLQVLAAITTWQQASLSWQGCYVFCLQVKHEFLQIAWPSMIIKVLFQIQHLSREKLNQHWAGLDFLDWCFFVICPDWFSSWFQ